MGFSVKVTGLDQVLRKLNQFPEKIQREIGGELKLAAQEVRSLAIRDVPVNNGPLKNAIIVDQKGPLTHTVTVEKAYAAAQEWGTKKNTIIPSEVAAYAAQFKGKSMGGGGVKLSDAIFQWVKRKGIGISKSGPSMRRRGQGARDKASQKGIAFVIARKIAKEGIKPHPFFFRNVFAVRDRLKTRIEAIVNSMNV